MVGAIIFIIVFGLMFAICRKYHKRGRMTVWGRNPHCRNCGEKMPEKLGATQGLEKLWCWKVKTYYCDACDRNGRKNGIVWDIIGWAPATVSSESVTDWRSNGVEYEAGSVVFVLFLLNIRFILMHIIVMEDYEASNGTMVLQAATWQAADDMGRPD